MLSDSLFEAYHSLLRQVQHYSTEPFEKDYPDSQKTNIIMALAHLDMARSAFDSPVEPDNKTFTPKEKAGFIKRAKQEFEKAVELSESDSE